MEWKYKMPSNIEMANAERFKDGAYPESELGSVVNIYAQAVAALGERLAYWQQQRTIKTTKPGEASVTIDIHGIPELQETLTKLKTAVEVAETERDAEVKRRDSAEMTMVAMVKKIEGLDDLLVRAYKSRDSWRDRAEGAEATLVAAGKAGEKYLKEPGHLTMRFRSGDQWFEMCLPRKL